MPLRYAHHSFATFDAGRQVTLQGTVKEFQWTNPHAWVILTVDRNGRPEQWAIEMSGPAGLARLGWRPKTLTPGMPVSSPSIRFATGRMAASSWKSRCPTEPSWAEGPLAPNRPLAGPRCLGQVSLKTARWRCLVRTPVASAVRVRGAVPCLVPSAMRLPLPPAA